MIRDLLVPLILVNGSLAATFAIFYQLVMICLQLGISPWIAAAVTFGGCGFIFWRMHRSAVRRWG
jgi:hypothetical protein